jgi:catechol 2,3-dioxygenase-like lactoylglutathione lyase family enzyme
MQLNHLNLCTDDVAALASFFTGHFGFELVAGRGDGSFAILRGSDGFALNLMKPGGGEPASYPEGFHVGFVVDRPETVRARHAELVEARWTVGAVETVTRGGEATTIFYCRAPGDLLVEVSALVRADRAS